MQVSSYVRGSARSWRLLVTFISAMLLASLSAAALPEPGTIAPPLQFTQLLQAPPGTKTDWESLRGKVVVLEFWETQCAPCIAEIPHLSKLVAELDPAKFQFISVDGVPSEDAEVVGVGPHHGLEPCAEHPGGLDNSCAGRRDVDGEVTEVGQAQVLEQEAAVCLGGGAHP